MLSSKRSARGALKARLSRSRKLALRWADAEPAGPTALVALREFDEEHPPSHVAAAPTVLVRHHQPKPVLHVSIDADLFRPASPLLPRNVPADVVTSPGQLAQPLNAADAALLASTVKLPSPPTTPTETRVLRTIALPVLGAGRPATMRKGKRAIGAALAAPAPAPAPAPNATTGHSAARGSTAQRAPLTTTAPAPGTKTTSQQATPGTAVGNASKPASERQLKLRRAAAAPAPAAAATAPTVTQPAAPAPGGIPAMPASVTKLTPYKRVMTRRTATAAATVTAADAPTPAAPAPVTTTALLEPAQLTATAQPRTRKAARMLKPTTPQLSDAEMLPMTTAATGGAVGAGAAQQLAAGPARRGSRSTGRSGKRSALASPSAQTSTQHDDKMLENNEHGEADVVVTPPSRAETPAATATPTAAPAMTAAAPDAGVNWLPDWCLVGDDEPVKSLTVSFADQHMAAAVEIPMLLPVLRDHEPASETAQAHLSTAAKQQPDMYTLDELTKLEWMESLPSSWDPEGVSQARDLDVTAVGVAVAPALATPPAAERAAAAHDPSSLVCRSTTPSPDKSDDIMTDTASALVPAPAPAPPAATGAGAWELATATDTDAVTAPQTRSSSGQSIDTSTPAAAASGKTEPVPVSAAIAATEGEVCALSPEEEERRAPDAAAVLPSPKASEAAVQLVSAGVAEQLHNDDDTMTMDINAAGPLGDEAVDKAPEVQVEVAQPQPAQACTVTMTPQKPATPAVVDKPQPGRKPPTPPAAASDSHSNSSGSSSGSGSGSSGLTMSLTDGYAARAAAAARRSSLLINKRGGAASVGTTTATANNAGGGGLTSLRQLPLVRLETLSTVCSEDSDPAAAAREHTRRIATSRAMNKLDFLSSFFWLKGVGEGGMSAPDLLPVTAAAGAAKARAGHKTVTLKGKQYVYIAAELGAGVAEPSWFAEWPRLNEQGAEAAVLALQRAQARERLSLSPADSSDSGMQDWLPQRNSRESHRVSGTKRGRSWSDSESSSGEESEQEEEGEAHPSASPLQPHELSFVSGDSAQDVPRGPVAVVKDSVSRPKKKARIADRSRSRTPRASSRGRGARKAGAVLRRSLSNNRTSAMPTGGSRPSWGGAGEWSSAGRFFGSDKVQRAYGQKGRADAAGSSSGGALSNGHSALDRRQLLAAVLFDYDE